MHRHRPYRLDGPWHTCAVILAAGRGERLGQGPKALLELAGRPLVAHVAAAMAANEHVTSLVIAAGDDLVERIEGIVRGAGLPVPVRVVAGGRTRQDSARAGLAALPPDAQWVAITDAARPLVPPGVVDGLIARLREFALGADPDRQPCGAAPVVPVVDSVHLVADGGVLARPFDRELLRAAQTPQFFRRECILDAQEIAGNDGAVHTDDVGLMSRVGGTVVSAPGTAANLKITFSADLALAEALYARAVADS